MLLRWRGEVLMLEAVYERGDLLLLLLLLLVLPHAAPGVVGATAAEVTAEMVGLPRSGAVERGAEGGLGVVG